MFDELLESTQKVDEISIMKPSSANLARKINKFFTKISLAILDEEELINAIEDLTDNARKALEDAVKEQDTNKIVNILGLKDIIKINPKLMYRRE